MMEVDLFLPEEELKPDLEPVKLICRCCLTTGNGMKNVSLYSTYFADLAGLNVSESDGLPQWVCNVCSIQLRRAVTFQRRLLQTHNMLYDYLTRCAPFPIDAQDSELCKLSRPSLRPTSMLTFDNSERKLGYHRVLRHQHESDSELVEHKENVKEELGFSDYEDNITLEEYRSNVSKVSEGPNITEDDLEQLLKVSEDLMKIKREKNLSKKKVKRSDSVKLEDTSDNDKPKSSVRKPVEIDPTKIRVITLNPEEQIKQREEESKANHKFPFQCNLCFKGFNFETKLQNHMSKHSPSRGKFKCGVCTMYLPTCYSYNVHMLIHTRRFECVACGRRMTDRASMIDHCKTHDGEAPLYTCEVCGKISSNSKTHRSHMRNHHSGDRPKCDQCGKTFINKDSLTEHIQIHLGVKNYSCGECGKRFRTRTQIKHHQLKHSDVKQFYCVECDIRFKSSHSLKQHLMKSLRHKDRDSFEHACASCDKRFESLSSLEAHARVQHLGVRAHVCGECGAALATRNSLAKHVRAVHRRAKPPPSHVCHTCGKLFRGKSVLVNHVRTHTGEKPFECPECGRKFTQRTAMRTHVKLVHLKIRGNAKLKTEAPNPPFDPNAPKLNMYVKDQQSGLYEPWSRPADYICIKDNNFKLERS